MSEAELDCLFEDSESEDCLLRNIEDFNKKYKDMKSWSEGKCRLMLTDEELQRYESIMPNANNKNKRSTIIGILKVNPCLRSLNPDILYQRISFYLWKYGEKTQRIHKQKKSPILTNVAKIMNQE